LFLFITGKSPFCKGLYPLAHIGKMPQSFTAGYGLFIPKTCVRNSGNTVDRAGDFVFIAGSKFYMRMAEQVGTIRITGTVDGACFYKMGGKYFARQKSTLSGRRVKQDPAFMKTMWYARLLARASVIASGVYRQLPEGKKERRLYRHLTGEAMKLLKSGKSRAEVILLLKREMK
jgi:hypothetical protein